MGFLSRLPDLSAVQTLQGVAQSSSQGLLSQLDGAASGGSGSPLGAVTETIGGLRQRLQIDVSGLERLSTTFSTIENALPDGSLEFLRGIEGAYGTARGALGDSGLARLVADGSSLEETALAFIDSAIGAFRDRNGQLAGGLLDTAKLESVTTTLQSFEHFRTDFSTHQAEFAGFVSSHLTGIAPNQFDAALSRLETGLSVFGSLQRPALDAALGPARGALATAYRSLAAAIDGFDANDAAAYPSLAAGISGVSSAAATLASPLETLYGALRTAVGAHGWDGALTELAAIVREIHVPAPFSVDDVFRALNNTLSDLVVRLQTIFAPEDLAQRISSVSEALAGLFTNSPVARVQRLFADFLGTVRQAIESIPVEQVQQAAESMLGRVREAVESAGLDRAGEAIESALTEAEEFITTNLNTGLGETVRAALRGLKEQLDRLPLDDLVDALAEVMGQLRELIAELETAVSEAVSGLEGFLSELEGLSFRPVADAVIQEIEALAQKLRQINPNALSDIERTALRAALAVLSALDLEGAVISGLKTGFREAGRGLSGVIDELAAVLQRLREQVDQYRPEQLLSPVIEAMNRGLAAVERLNGRLLLGPIYEQVDAAIRELGALSPGAILTPLEEPFQGLLSLVDRIDPASWLEPLRGVHEAIDHLVDVIDVRPLLTELDGRRRALLAEARDALLGALDAANPPEPIKSFLNTLRPFVAAMSEALFGDPDGELTRISTELRANVRLSAFLEPLDRVFDELRALLVGIPPDALIDAFNVVRRNVRTGLDTLDPRRVMEAFQAGLAAAEAVNPDGLVHPLLALPALRRVFDAKVASAVGAPPAAVTAVQAAFDAALDAADPTSPMNAIQTLRVTHRELLQELRSRVVALDSSGLGAAYAEFSQGLERVVPEFLRGPNDLSRDDILLGLESLRPSRLTASIDRLVDDFLRKLAPLSAAVAEPTNEFFRSLRTGMDLLNPLALRDALGGIYDTIRDKLGAIDPVRIAELLRQNVFLPVREGLESLDPAHWHGRLDAAYQRIVGALSTNVRGILDQVMGIVEEELRALRETLTRVTGELTATLGTVTSAVSDVLDRVENLVFVELVERLRRLVDNLQNSFDRELDRVRASFDQMLAAIPLADARPRTSASAGASA